MNDDKKHLLANTYDVVIVGGGIQGCGCAQAFAAAGYSVLLIEQNTLGSATSSQSSKLIHGGLRYLETGQWSLVKKSLAERALLCKLAPELVSLKPFYLPVYQQQRLQSWQLFAGLSLYSALGKFSPASRFRRLPQEQWATLAGLRQNGLRCVFQYQDAQTDDRLLTLAVAHSATQLGATIIEQCRFVSAEKLATNNDIRIELAQLSNERKNGEQNISVTAKVLVNAAGPWVQHVLKSIDFARDFENTGPDVALVQGAHIELDQPIGDGIFYVESPIDQRAVFVMPWQGRTMVGTTEQAYDGNPADVSASNEEVQYLTNTIKHYFPNYRGQLVDQWAGLRVLPQPAKTDTSTLRPFSSQARDTMIHCDNEHKPRLISLYGGKLTAYRVTAEHVVTKAKCVLGERTAKADTANLRLTTPSPGDRQDFRA